MINSKTIIFGLIGMVGLMMTLSNPAHACGVNTPAGVEGEIIYNSSFAVPTYCDGTNWIAMKGGVGNYIPNAVEFDGVTDSVTTTNSLTGTVDTKQVTYSYWAKFDAAYASAAIIYNYANSGLNHRFRFGHNTGGHIFMENINSGTTTLIVNNTTVDVYDGQWNHVLCSFDMSNPTNRHCYVNDIDVSATGWSTYIDDFILLNYAPLQNDVMMNGSAETDGDIADLWINFGTYIDLSVEANRRKFIDAIGNPVNLGENGANPTGAAPDIFLSGNTDNWHTNKGTGGGFTENGTLTTATTIPYTPITKTVPTGLVAHWRFDEDSVPYLDSVGTNNLGNVLPATAPITTDGIIGKSLDLLAARGLESVNIAGLENLDTISVSFWLNLDYAGGYECLVSADDVFRIRNQGFNRDELTFYAKSWSGNDGRFSVDDILTEYDSQWVHYAVTYDYNAPLGTDPMIYANGVLQPVREEAAPTGTFSVAAGGNVIVGRGDVATDNCDDDSSVGINGMMDDLRIYNRVITPAEVTEIYNARDGIRYNANQRKMEYFDGNAFVSMTPEWIEVDEGPSAQTCPSGITSCGIDPTERVVFNLGPISGAPSTYGGLSGADNQCQINANSNGLKGTYFAWLTDSDPNNAPAFRFEQSTHPYVMPNGTKIADNWTDLTDGTIDNIINIVSDGTAYSGSINQIATNTNTDGTQASATNHCSNYSSSSGSVPDGRANSTTGTWTINGTRLCNAGTRLYCFQQGAIPIEYGGLVAHYKLDETSGTTAVDSSGGGNNGTLGGTVNFDDHGISSAPINRGLNMIGTRSNGQRVTVTSPTTDIVNMRNITVATWVNVNEAAGLNGMFEVANLFRLEHNFNDTRVLFRANGWDTEGAYLTTTDINLNEWMHVAATYSYDDPIGTRPKIYFNGVEQTVGTANTAAGSFTTPTTPSLFVGSTNGTANWLRGQMDDARLYDRILSATEIMQLYQMGTPVGSSTALPLGCPNIGDVCDDGTIYAGLRPIDGTTRLFMAPQDELGTYQWGSIGTDRTGASSDNLGDDNTNHLAQFGASAHPAVNACYDKDTLGYDDWYLGGFNEMGLFYNGGEQIGGIITDGSNYWTSRNVDANSGRAIDFDNALSFQNIGKNGSLLIRCIRKGPAPRCANPYGLEGQMTYNTTHDVVQYCDGARWIGIGKYN